MINSLVRGYLNLYQPTLYFCFMPAPPAHRDDATNANPRNVDAGLNDTTNRCPSVQSKDIEDVKMFQQ